MYDLSHEITEELQTFPGDPDVKMSPSSTHKLDGCRVTEITLGTHTGTHVDAPAHIVPDGRTLEAYPLDRFVLDTFRVDCLDLPERHAIPPDCVPDFHVDCIVFYTGWDAYMGSETYKNHPYLAPETARKCASKGFDVGLDTLNPDPTPTSDAREQEPDGFPAHNALLRNDLIIVENLTNLGEVPERFDLHIYPLPVSGDGAPVRAVGMERGGGGI